MGRGVSLRKLEVEARRRAKRARKAYESEAYKKALQALGSGAERDFRIVEGG
jgi:hypothetical protein